MCLLVLTLSSHLVNEFGLPEQHWVPLVFVCFFLSKSSQNVKNCYRNMTVKVRIGSHQRRRFWSISRWSQSRYEKLIQTWKIQCKFRISDILCICYLELSLLSLSWNWKSNLAYLSILMIWSGTYNLGSIELFGLLLFDWWNKKVISNMAGIKMSQYSGISQNNDSRLRRSSGLADLSLKLCLPL